MFIKYFTIFTVCFALAFTIVSASSTSLAHETGFPHSHDRDDVIRDVEKARKKQARDNKRDLQRTLNERQQEQNRQNYLPKPPTNTNSGSKKYIYRKPSNNNGPSRSLWNN